MKFYTYFLFLFPVFLNSQEIDLAASAIPKELVINADAVIRLNQKTIFFEDIDKMTTTITRIVTVFNKDGNRHIDAYRHYDGDTKISKLSAIYYDKYGKKISKYSKSKFEDVSAVAGGAMYTDDRLKYLDLTPTSYPYTLRFDCEVSTKTTGFIPSWNPIEAYDISIERSNYTLINKKNIPIRIKEKNFNGFNITQSATVQQYFYELTHQKPIVYEAKSISSEERFPKVTFGPEVFSLKGVKAEVSNWAEFGSWMRKNLYENRIELSDATKLEIQKLTAATNDTLEKAKLVYQYMQNKTRYVNVSIGIGGWQPSLASEVDKLGYGDCKGLSNYTKALMDAAGISSYWTVVYAKNRRDFDKEYHGIEGNHMILNLPYKGEDIWLECTSQTTPFGFLGTFTDDRDALVLTETGGVIKHTTSYKNEDNAQLTYSTIKLDNTGNLTANVKIETTGTQYNQHYGLEDHTDKELDEHYKNSYWSYNNALRIHKHQFKNDRDSIFFTEKLDVTIDNYATLTKTNMLVRVNAFNKFTHIPTKYRNRKTPLKIDRGFVDTDHFIFEVPAGYLIENLPEAKNLTTPFGDYQVSIQKLDATHFEYKRRFFLKAGLFPKEDYAPYRDFIKEIVKHDNLRIALEKQDN